MYRFTTTALTCKGVHLLGFGMWYSAVKKVDEKKQENTSIDRYMFLFKVARAYPCALNFQMLNSQILNHAESVSQ